MARTRVVLTADGLVGGFARPVADDMPAAVLDVAESLLRRHGLHRWRMEDLADEAAVSRTSLYRWFGSRQEVVEAVLVRELRRTIAEMGLAAEDVRAAGGSRHEELTALVVRAVQLLQGSVVDHLLQHDPESILPLLTVEAGPLVAIARKAIAPWILSRRMVLKQAEAETLAELVARIGLSFVLTRPVELDVNADGVLTPDSQAELLSFGSVMARAASGLARVRSDDLDGSSRPEPAED